MVEIRHRHPRAGTGEGNRDGGAESARAARDNGYLASQVVFHFYQAIGRLPAVQALRFHASHDVRHEEVEPPGSPTGRQVLIAPVVCGICGTDVHEYADGPLRTTVEPHPLTGGHVPQILGHELSGVVVEVGPEVDALASGDRVSVMPLLSCGTCAVCRSGREQMCDLRAAVGLRHPWGGMGELALVDADQAVPNATR